ncbi:SpoIIE family protein phosphatase [Mycobacterium simiae]|uniref:SpoIIE family protein phosphatase n=1 Tax=Mycobacterium simiae TaxID=1784 RepID=A0A5B1BLA6_MYCSI|nr:SpoIIE family protein phosphatase [Mycobacterium simiae]KAA1249458.1 SpoIIE family protein phosphatase [Mycobacterium simiae]
MTGGEKPTPVALPTDQWVDEFVPVGTPIDLDNCDREPIHIPGSIQPRGVLAVVRERDFEVRQVSANIADQLGRSVDAVLNRHLSVLIGADQAARVEQAASSFSDPAHHIRLDCAIEVRGEPCAFDAILSRASAGVLLVEFESASDVRPFSLPNPYQEVRSSLEELNRATTLTELYETAVRAVRDLTGFDRVMVYRYDEDYNGEVVAESKRADLNSFLGLHYPASDIPAQARALYEKNWLRLISDVDYTPAPLVPAVDSATGTPLDLTYATLRSVSPIHIEYLRNMGVRASMSISLLRHDRLWGLIACHHHAGPHLPSVATRTAAELLGSTLSLRFVDRLEDDQLRKRLAAQAVLAKLTVAMLDDGEPLAAALLGASHLLDLVPADGVVVNVQGDYRVRGSVPSPQVVSAVAAWARGAAEEIASTECLSRELPELDLDPQLAAGVLMLNLPDGQYAGWFRREVLRSVDWGGDPHNKAIAVREGSAGNQIRMSPRKSFDRWREIVRHRSHPWTPSNTECAAALRRLLVESLYRRARGALRMAETVQRSLLRAHLFAGTAPAESLSQLNDFCVHMLPGALATVFVARVDLGSGQVEAASGGQLIPYLTNPSEPTAEPAPIRLSPPIGVRGVTYAPSTFTVQPGQGLVMFSDGLVERRRESIDEGLNRLAETLGRAGNVPASWIGAAMALGNAEDDVTIIALHRP